jgi:hypothetical protein
MGLCPDNSIVGVRRESNAEVRRALDNAEDRLPSPIPNQFARTGGRKPGDTH